MAQLRLLARDALLRAAFAVFERLQFGGVLATELFDCAVASLAGGEGEACAELAFGFAWGGGCFRARRRRVRRRGRSHRGMR